MNRQMRLTIAALTIASTIPLAARPALTAASTFQTSKATLTSASGGTVGTASSLCAPTFNYFLVNVTAITLTVGATVWLTPPGGPAKVIAQSSNSSPYIASYPATCPPAGSLVTVYNNAPPQAQIGFGTLPAYTPYLAESEAQAIAQLQRDLQQRLFR